MSVQILKLSTGENVLAEVTATQEGRYVLTHPVTIRAFPSKIQGGEPSLGFAPWPDFGNFETPEPILVDPLHVAYTYVPQSDMVKEYNRMVEDITKGTTSSGIITG